MSAWPTLRLDDCCEIVSGATPSTSVAAYWDGDIHWATPKDLSDLDGPLISDTPRKISKAGLEACAATVLPPGSVLFSSRAPIGHVAINTTPMATNQGFKSFVPHKGRMHAGYLYHWLRCNRSYLEGLGNGATFKEVSKAVVSRIELPVPPIGEQRRIAAILDEADALRAKRRAALAQLDEMARAIFVEMFGEVNSANTKTPLSKLSVVCKRITDGTHQPPKWSLHGVPFLGISNITTGEIDFTSQKMISEQTYVELTRRCPVEVGDILYSTVGATYGIPALVREAKKFAFQRHIAHIKPDFHLIDSRFLCAMLAAPGIKVQADKAAKGAAQKTINLTDLSEFQILIPPMPEQKVFVQRLDYIKSLRNAGVLSQTHLDSLFASLQHRAFRGEL